MSGTTSNVAAMVKPPETIDPVARLGQLAQTGNALMQNKLMNEQFNSRQAIGQAAVGAIDPATGHFSPDNFRQRMTQNPLSQFMSMEALGQAAQLDLQQEALMAQQAQLGMLRLNNLRQAIGGLIARQNVTDEDVINEIGRLASLPASERPFTPTMAAQVLATMPRDPAQRREWLISQMARTDAGLAHLQNLLPQAQLLPYGGGTMGVAVDPLRGTVAPSGFVQPNTPSPEQDNQLVEVTTPDGRRVFVRNADLMPTRPGAAPPGQRPAATPGTPPGAPPLAPPGATLPAPSAGPLGTGRFPSAPTGAAPTAPGQPLAALSPSEVAAQGVTGQAGGQSVARLNAAAQQVPQMEALLANADSLIRNFEPGPGADWQKWFQATFNRNVPLLRSLGVEFDPNRIASQEEFNKITSQIAQAQFNALGGTGTDNQLASTAATSPSEVLTRYGNQGIIAMLRGNNQALKVQQQAWQQWARQNGAGPERYSEFTAWWNNNFDPRVFTAAYAPASMRRQMVNAMSTDEYKQYEQRFREALVNGWIRPPTRDIDAAVRRSRTPPTSGPSAPPVYQPPQSFGLPEGPYNPNGR